MSSVTFWHVCVCFFFFFLATTAGGRSAQEDSESFNEALRLRPASGGDVVAHFDFVTLSRSVDNGDHFNLFPRALGELLAAHGVAELELSLTRGVWRKQRWGSSPNPSPPGATVSAWFDPAVTSDVDKAWTGLTNALAGQLCASLNFLYSTQTISPNMSFQPKGVVENGISVNSSFFRIGFLPGENVCTENLSPWKKLLPCQAQRGLSALLLSKNIHHTKFHSLGLSVRRVCGKAETTCSNPSLEHSQSVTLVFAPDVSGDNHSTSKMAWSLRTVFGIGLLSTCPLAESSKILIEKPEKEDSNDDDMDIRPAVLVKESTGNGCESSLVEIDVNELVDGDYGNNVYLSYRRGLVSSQGSKLSKFTSGLRATRYVVGYGQERGEFVTKLTNDEYKKKTIVFLDVLPWYLRVYFHTLRVTRSDTKEQIQPLKSSFQPGVDREKPYSMELVLELPPKATTTISVSFEKSILKWLEYPPDANHGFYVSSAVVTEPCIGQGDSCCPGGSKRIFTETILMTLPTPDFSMPYNVICLACTVVALAFGPLHNITTKRLVVEKESDKGNDQSVLERIKSRVQKLLRREQKEAQSSQVQEEEREPLTEEKAE